MKTVSLILIFASVAFTGSAIADDSKPRQESNTEEQVVQTATNIADREATAPSAPDNTAQTQKQENEMPDQNMMPYQNGEWYSQ